MELLQQEEEVGGIGRIRIRACCDNHRPHSPPPNSFFEALSPFCFQPFLSSLLFLMPFFEEGCVPSFAQSSGVGPALSASPFAPVVFVLSDPPPNPPQLCSQAPLKARTVSHVQIFTSDSSCKCRQGALLCICNRHTAVAQQAQRGRHKAALVCGRGLQHLKWKRGAVRHQSRSSGSVLSAALPARPWGRTACPPPPHSHGAWQRT